MSPNFKTLLGIPGSTVQVLHLQSPWTILYSDEQEFIEVLLACVLLPALLCPQRPLVCRAKCLPKDVSVLLSVKPQNSFVLIVSLEIIEQIVP